MSENKKEYLVQVQVESIQTYLFDYLSKATNQETLREAKYNSKLIKEITDVLSEDTLFRKYLFEKITLERDKVYINISGKVLIKLDQAKKEQFCQNYTDNYCQFIEKGIELSYACEQITDNEQEAYENLKKQMRSSKRQNSVQTNIDYFALFHKNEKAEIQLQSTEQVLEEYCENCERGNKNQIAIIKIDLNNIGNYFQDISIEQLKDESEKFDKEFQQLSPQDTKNQVYTLYAAGDDIMIICRVEKIEKVLEHFEKKLAKMNVALTPRLPITAGVAVLTTDYRSTFRYYLEHVEELLNEVKQEKTMTMVNLNGLKLEMNKMLEFINTVCKEAVEKTQDAVNYNTDKKGKNKISNTKMHNVLDIIEQSKFPRLDAMYILSKDECHTVYTELFKKIEKMEDTDFESPATVEQLKYYIQNILLFSKYLTEPQKNLKKMENITYTLNTQVDIPISESSETIGESTLQLKQYILVDGNDKSPINNKGFWFKLNELLRLKLEEQLSTYLLNYQYNNKFVIRYEFADDASEKAHRDGWEPEDKERRKQVNDYRTDVAQTKKVEAVQQLVKKMIDESEAYQKLCREVIIYLNINKKLEGDHR